MCINDKTIVVLGFVQNAGDANPSHLLCCEKHMQKPQKAHSKELSMLLFNEIAKMQCDTFLVICYILKPDQITHTVIIVIHMQELSLPFN